MKYVVGFIFCLFFQSLNAQQVFRQSQTWMAMNIQFPVSKKQQFQLELIERTFTEKFQHQLWAIRGIYRVNLSSNHELGLGLANFQATQNDPIKQPRVTLSEIRPSLEYTYRFPLRKCTFEQRIRAEARLVEGELAAYRWRYRMQGIVPIQSRLDLRLNSELLIHSGGISARTFDQVRFFAGMIYKMTPQNQIEMGYLHQLQSKGSEDLFERPILWITFQHRIKKH